MARHRPWEPLLIMVAIVLANAGLVTVLLINEGATQGELLQSKQVFFTGSIITPVESKNQIEQDQRTPGSVKHEHSAQEHSSQELSAQKQVSHEYFKRERFTKEDYATLRRHGFTQLIAISERSITLFCSDNEETSITLNLLGVDTQPLLGSAFRAENKFISLASLSLGNGKKGSKTTSNARVLRANSPDTFYANGLIHPVTNAKLTCHDTLNESDKESTSSLYWPATLNTYVSSLVQQDTIVISIDDFYRGGISLTNNEDDKKSDPNDIVKQQKSFVPLTGLVSLSPLSEQSLGKIERLLGLPVKQSISDRGNDTGSLPDSFRLNLWAMSALMGVVSLFIVLNALNLMYRTRLPNVIRLRQLGISKRVLGGALFVELLIYCVISIPIGMFIGFQAASTLSPVISGTFTSLFNAVFINPDVNLLFVFGFALVTTFTSLVVFSLASIAKLSNALTVHPVRKEKAMLARDVGFVSLAAVVLRFIAEAFVTSTASALTFVALLLLTSCVIVLLWLPIIAKLLTTFVPRQWPVFHYVIANMHLLSSKTRLAVCAFFIALTANIGMNTMTDSFRSATEQWLEQRLYAPFYLYTDVPLSNVESLTTNSLFPLAVTPLLKADGEVLSLNGIEETEEVTPKPTYISISSYPVHQKGKEGLVLDSVINNNLSTAWRAFTEGKGIFINQQLAFALKAELGDMLNVTNVRFRKGISESSSSNTSIFSTRPEWKILGIYPDYGNLNGQILAPLPLFNKQSVAVRNNLFSGVLAIYPNPDGYQEVAASSEVTFTKETLEQQLKAHLGDEADITLYSRQALLNISMDTFDRTFVLTDGLNITTLLVAGIAFAVSLTVLTIGSSAQLSVLRALGVSQFKVKLSLFMQYLLLCFVSALLAIPFGIYLAYIFINLVNRYAFNWVYPLSIDVDVILSSVGVSLLIVSLVLLLPLGKLKPKIDLRQEVQL